MTNALLFVLVLGVLAIALGVDVGALVSFVKGRWR
jgi:hypothetical protein